MVNLLSEISFFSLKVTPFLKIGHPAFKIIGQHEKGNEPPRNLHPGTFDGK